MHIKKFNIFYMLPTEHTKTIVIPIINTIIKNYNKKL